MIYLNKLIHKPGRNYNGEAAAAAPPLSIKGSLLPPNVLQMTTRLESCHKSWRGTCPVMSSIRRLFWETYVPSTSCWRNKLLSRRQTAMMNQRVHRSSFLAFHSGVLSLSVSLIVIFVLVTSQIKQLILGNGGGGGDGGVHALHVGALLAQLTKRGSELRCLRI